MEFVAKQFGLRRVADRVERRLRRLVGRDDGAPWILDPPPRRRTAHVDFILALDYLSPNSRLLKCFHDAFAAYGLSVLLVNKKNIDRVSREIETGWVRPYVYLDLSSVLDQRFEKLIYTAAENGVYTIRRPEDTRWIMKDSSHGRLEQAGLPVPPTVILRNDEPDRELTADEVSRVGEECIIKPSNGVGGRGTKVIRATKEQIAAARGFNRKDHWLIQKKIVWAHFKDRPAYVRAYNICGHRTLLWWVNDTRGYSAMSWEDYAKYELHDAVQIIDRIEALTGMDYFSSEIAIVKERGPDRLVLIDYINDQCDLDPDACGYSPPIGFARVAAERFADFVYRKKNGLPAGEHRGLFLFK